MSTIWEVVVVEYVSLWTIFSRFPTENFHGISFLQFKLSIVWPVNNNEISPYLNVKFFSNLLIASLLPRN